MNIALEAKQLADFVKSLNLNSQVTTTSHNPYEHIGGLYTNVILQAGLNYRTVVFPRVTFVMNTYPTANTVNGFLDAIQSDGIENVIRWKHQDKIQRMLRLLDFSLEESINTCEDLAEFLRNESNHEVFLRIKGIGNKTLDYTRKLLAFDTIAVDRHIYGFLELAGLPNVNYATTKRTVEFAADLLNVSRSSLDHRIWLFMSSKSDNQTRIAFT